MRSVKGVSLGLALAIGAMSCSGGKDSGTGPDLGNFTVSLSSSSLSIQAGTSGSVTATITRSGSFSGTVTLSVENLPTGIGASINPSVITSGVTSGTLTVDVAASVAPGPYNFTIRGKATGLTDRTGTVTVTVTAAAAPDFSLSVNPNTKSLQQGSNGTVTVQLTRTGGFAGAVTLALEGAPAGVTGAFSQNPVANIVSPDLAGGALADVAPTSITLTITVGAAVAAQDYPLTIRGTAQGQADRTAALTLTVTLPPSYAMSLNPTSLTVQQGQNGQTTVSVQRTAFAAGVTLSVENLPAGVTVAFGQNPLAGDNTLITLTVGAAVAPNVYNLTVRGVATGLTDRTAPLTLTVTEPPSFVLELLPTALSVQQGSTGSVTAQITRHGGFAGPVTLAATAGVPAGVTVTFDENPVAGGSTEIHFNVSAGAATGQSTITIQGSGTGVANDSRQVVLTVTQAPSGTNVDIHFCGGVTFVPVWVAYQNAGGVWTVAPAGANDTWQINIGANSGLAYVIQYTQNSQVISVLNIMYGTLTEFQQQATGLCFPAATKTVTGSATGFDVTDNVQVSLGGSTAFVPFGLSTFTLQNVPDGVQDLLGVRSAFVNPGSVPVSLVIQRGLNPANNADLGTLNFAVPPASAPATATATVNNTNGEVFSLSSSLYTANSSALAITTDQNSSTTSRTYYGVPNGLLIGSDLQLLSARSIVNVGTLTIRTVGEFFTTVADRTLTLGALFNTPTVSVAGTTNYTRLRTVLTRQSDYNSFVIANYTQVVSGSVRTVLMSATSGAMGAATDFDATMPDFHGLPGWSDAWGFVTGTAVNWFITASGWTGTGVTGATPAAGVIMKTAAKTGAITP